MAQQINLEILIDGSLKVTPFTSLSVHQQINGHHSFEVRFNHDVKSGKSTLPISKYQEYLGKSISITFGDDMYKIMQNHTDKVFKGVITEVAMSNTSYEPGNMIIKGYSPSILLETNKNCSFHLDKNLQQIISKMSQSLPGNVLNFNVKPSNWKKTIPYMVQYNETDFEFIKRMAADYGEWLFYNGTDLYFGKPSSIPVVKVSYPEDISELKLSEKLLPLNYQKSAFTLKKDNDTYSSPTSGASLSGLGIYGDDALKKSNNTFLTKAASPALLNIQDKAHLDSYVKAQKGADAAKLVVLHANCDNPGVQVGTILDVSSEGSNMGKYFVISAEHTSDGLGNYTNTFEAIPSEVEFLPAPDFERPYIEPQIGKVVDNKDPDGFGRIKACLLWQNDNDKSALPWMQYMSTSAGGKENRGIHFTPEIDDHVVIGFTQNDPSKPFVMGSIPLEENQKTSSNNKNFEKVIRTRSGNTIYFRDKDDDKEQEIRLETDKANYLSIIVKNGDGTIEIKSSKEITVTSYKEINVKSENIKIEAKKDIVMKAEGKIEMKAGQDIITEGNSIKLKANSDIKLDGMNVEVSAQVGAKVKGNAQAELSASGQTTVKGAIVMIN